MSTQILACTPRLRALMATAPLPAQRASPRCSIIQVATPRTEHCAPQVWGKAQCQGAVPRTLSPGRHSPPRVVYFKTPVNPTLDLMDIALVRRWVDAVNVQRPPEERLLITATPGLGERQKPSAPAPAPAAATLTLRVSACLTAHAACPGWPATRHAPLRYPGPPPY
jgi:hypothetical protein